MDQFDPNMNSTGSIEPVREEFQQYGKDFDTLMEAVTPMIKDLYDQSGRPRSNPMATLNMPPDILEKLIPITEEGQDLDAVIKNIDTTMKMSLNTMHPYFFDKLYAGSEPVGQVAELVATVLNTCVHVYHVSPVFSVMEVEAVKIFGRRIGYEESTIDGVLSPGGTMSNMLAFLAARNEKFPHVRRQGWKVEDRPVAFTAAHSHYSINRAAMVSGMGMDQMI